MSKVKWDYTDLAEAYLKRPDYSDDAIDRLVRSTGLSAGALVCDVGAGVGHLTIKLAERDLEVVSVEPNEAMMTRGKARTAHLPRVRWADGAGEQTGQPSSSFDLVTFGSSFNVVDQDKALSETWRILKPRGWFACMWNHRRLDDPIQAKIEDVIKANIPNYDYGSRRADQTQVILDCGLFNNVEAFEEVVYHVQSVEDCLEAWRSHATLQRQAGDSFDRIIDGIANVLHREGSREIDVPYTTVVWIAQATKAPLGCTNATV